MVGGDPFWTCAYAQERLQALVKQIQSGKIMQDALVDAQRRRRQAATRLDFEKTIAAKWARWRKCAPVRVFEHSHGQAKGYTSLLRMTLRLGTLRRQLGVHLDAGAKQEQLALEAAQAENFGQLFNCRRRFN